MLLRAAVFDANPGGANRTIHPKDVAARDFAKKFDILVFAGASESEIEKGKPPKKWEKWATPAPPEYSGRIGEKGEKPLKEMTKAGKILVFMEKSCNYAINKFKTAGDQHHGREQQGDLPRFLPAGRSENVSPDGGHGKAARPFSSTPPRPSRPRCRGRPTRAAPRRWSSPSATCCFPAGSKAKEQLVRRSLLLDYRKGKGRIILIGPDVIHRTHTEATCKIMFNYLLAAAAVK